MTSPRTLETVSIRRMRAEDADGIAALYAACAGMHDGVPKITAQSWAKDVALPQFGYGRDYLVVATDEAELIGLAESSLRDQGVRRYRHLRFWVHPAHRRIGVGTALLRAVLDQGPAEGALRLGGNIPAGWGAGLAFAERFGFERIEFESKMRCSALLRVRDAPPDVSIGPATDVAALAPRIAAIHDEAFADDAGFTPTTANDMRRILDGMDLWTASVADETVGYALIEPDDKGGTFETLAVVPEQRGRGIGAALAFRALDALRLGGDRTADLGVSSMNPGARRIYERLGFVLRHDVGRYATTRDHLVSRLTG